MRCLALLAESDPALRSLLARVLRGVDWDVEECPSSTHLRADLAGRIGSEAARLLLVSSSLHASACAEEISTLARPSRR